MINTLSEADTAKLYDMTRVFADDWIAQANAAGLDGAALMASYEKIVADLK